MQIQLTQVLPKYKIPERLNERPFDIIALGSLVTERVISIERWPEAGGQDVVPVQSITDTSGGCAMNVGCFAARQGAKAAVISGIGDGQYARVTWNELAASGVITDFLIKHHDREGSLIIILTNPSGDWAVLEYIDEELSLRLEDIPPTIEFQRTKFLHIDGFSYISVGEKGLVQEAVYRAREAGCLISVDASVPAAKIERDFLETLFHQADVVFANLFEAFAVTKTSDVQSAIESLQRMGPEVAVLKVGPEGSYVISPEAVGYIPAYEVDVVDTVAAGDAYIGTLLHSLSRGLPLMKAASRGSAAGALACLGRGSLSSRFSGPEIDALLARGPKKV